MVVPIRGWEEYFTNNFKHFLEMKNEVRGPATEDREGDTSPTPTNGYWGQTHQTVSDSVGCYSPLQDQVSVDRASDFAVSGDMRHSNTATDVFTDEPIVSCTSAS
jgi:hypothetical protein